MSDTQQNTKVGFIVKKADAFTATVNIEVRILHPKYKKIVKRSKKYLVHNPLNRGEVGDKVVIVECRPVSKRKKWRLKSVVK